MNFVDIVEKDNQIDLVEKVKEIYNAVIICVEQRIDLFKSGIYKDTHKLVLSQRKNTLTDFHLYTLKIYLKSKNELLRLAKNPIYSFCLDEINFDYLNRLSAIYLLHHETQSLDDFLKGFQASLEDITYHNKIINFPDWMKEKLNFDFISDNVSHPYFEGLYINFLRIKVQELTDDKTEFRDFLVDNIFNWNILSIGYFYHFLRENNLLLPNISFTNFKNYLHPENITLIQFDLNDSSYTKSDLEFILNCLQRYYYLSDRNKFINWVQNRVRYTSKHNNVKFGDSFEIQLPSTFNKYYQKPANNNRKSVVDMFQTLDLLENSTAYLNQS